ncbi:MAG: hypothetical protein J5643_06245 [Lachnospiraceae bacterium]|nr:hypothetical protein [Lachnospiraceae bacterium]
MKRKKLLCLLVSAVLLTGCGLLPQEEKARKAPVNKTTVDTQYFTTATVARGDVARCYTLVCNYGKQEVENLAFNLPNELLVGLYVKQGDPVYEGQLLAEITLGELEDEIERCEETCKQTDEDLKYYTQMVSFEQERQKLAKDWGRKYDTAKLDELTAKRDDLAGQKIVADLKLKEANEKMKGRRLYASFNGIVTFVREMRPWERTNTNTFITVASNETGFLATIENENLDMFKQGEVYSIETETETIPCTLYEIKEDSRVKTKSRLVFIPTDPELEFEGGENGIISIVLEDAKNVIYIPTNALRKIGDKDAVYILDKDGMRDIRYVEVGLSVEDKFSSVNNRTEIKSGLSEGDIIIIK